MLILQLTETAEHPISLEAAWRQVTGDVESSVETARTLAVYDKVWFRRKFGMGLIAAMDAYGLGLMDFVQRLKTHLDAPKRDGKGAILKDPQSKTTLPDYTVQRRALALYQKLLQMAGAMGVIEPSKPTDRIPLNDGEGERNAAQKFRDELREKGTATDVEAEDAG